MVVIIEIRVIFKTETGVNGLSSANEKFPLKKWVFQNKYNFEQFQRAHLLG